YHHPRLIEAFGRTVLEGIAAGAVAIVDPSFEETFQEACLYAPASNVRATIDHLTRYPDEYVAQSQLGARYAEEHFSYRTHRDRIVRLIGDTGSQHSDESQKLTPTGSADLESQVEMLLVCTGEEFLEAISSRLESELDVSNEKEIAVLVPQEHA